MALSEMMLIPQRASYSVQRSGDTLYSKPGVGVGTRRSAPLRQPKLVSCLWHLNGVQYTYQRAFIRSVLEEGSLPFSIKLLIYPASMVLYQAAIVKNTFKLSQQKGDLYVTVAQLAIVPMIG